MTRPRDGGIAQGDEVGERGNVGKVEALRKLEIPGVGMLCAQSPGGGGIHHQHPVSGEILPIWTWKSTMLAAGKPQQ